MWISIPHWTKLDKTRPVETTTTRVKEQMGVIINYMFMCLYVSKGERTCVCVCMCIRVCMYGYLWCVRACLCLCIYACVFVHVSMYLCVSIYLCLCLCVCVHVSMSVSMCMCPYIYVCVYVYVPCIYVCVYMCPYIYVSDHICKCMHEGRSREPKPGFLNRKGSLNEGVDAPVARSTRREQSNLTCEESH